AQESYALGWAIRLRQLIVEQRRHPVAAQQSTHRGAGSHARQAFVILTTEHADLPLVSSRYQQDPSDSRFPVAERYARARPCKRAIAGLVAGERHRRIHQSLDGDPVEDFRGARGGIQPVSWERTQHVHVLLDESINDNPIQLLVDDLVTESTRGDNRYPAVTGPRLDLLSH